MTPIKAQFLHQHKDKVVYENIIFIDSPRIQTYNDNDELCHPYLVFEIPVTRLYERFIPRWYKSNRMTRITKRSMRFVDSDGTILFRLQKRALKVKLDTNNRRYNMCVIEVTCSVHKDEIRDLAKIFQK